MYRLTVETLTIAFLQEITEYGNYHLFEARPFCCTKVHGHISLGGARMNAANECKYTKYAPKKLNIRT